MTDPFVPLPWSLSRQSAPQRYVLAALLVLLIAWPLYRAGDWVSDDNEMLLYLGCGIFSALYLGRGPARLASLLCLFLLHIASIHPGFRFPVHGYQYLISFGFFVVVTDQVARLADNVRREAWLAHRREKAGELLRAFTQGCSMLSSEADLQELLRQAVAPFPCAPGPQQAQPQYVWRESREKDLACLLVQSMQEQCALAQERLKHREQKREAAVLEATQKLQTTLINSISHDLQTPLSSISGTIATLRMGGEQMASQDREDLLQLASEQTQRLEKLVKNILNLSKLEGGGLKPNWGWVALPELVSLVQSRFSPAVAARFRFQLQEPLPEVKGDFTLLSQVLSNLLDNAAKFSRTDSPVEITMGTSQEGQVTVQVADHGFGVESGDTDKIFDKFYRGKTPVAVPGSGLGLNICKAVIELHQGEIGCRPRPGGGSVFWFTLPAPLVQHEAA